MPAKVIHGHSIEIELGPSCPNPGIRRELEAQGKPYMCTSDIATWSWWWVLAPLWIPVALVFGILIIALIIIVIGAAIAAYSK